MYDNHRKYEGTEPEFKKNPPKIKKGIINGPPTDKATEIFGEPQDIK